MGIKGLIIGILTIFIAIALISFDSKKRNQSSLSAQLEYIKVTKIIEPSFSTSPLEDRFLYLQKTSNKIFAELPKSDKLGFVYVR